jgi:hypothetical protein
MTAARKRPPTLSAEIAAIIRGGLCPRLVRRPDGSIELTGLPPEPEDTDEKYRQAIVVPRREHL